MVGERITFGGVASGIDTNLIIDQLMQVARRPILIAENRRAQVEQKTQAFGQVTSGLSSLLTRLEALNTIDTYRNRATSVLAKDVDANKVTAVASAGAALGAYSVHVTQRATASITTSATAVGQAIDAGVPMDQAGFGSALQTGTFSINGTQFTIDAASARTVTSAASVGAGFDADVPLDQGGLDIPPVVGSFTINGATINYDPATDQISDVVSYINNSSAEVTASFDDATKTFTLTHKTAGAAGTITMADVSGNFLESMKILDGGGGTIGVEVAGTDVRSLDDVIDEINNAGIGVTASLVQDAYGRDNLLEITSGASIQLGSGGDTSNFLSLTSLLESPPGTTRTSQRGLGAVSRTEDLAGARLDVALTETQGVFKVNGIEITYDADVDSITNLITRINNSDAGVTVTYDTHADLLRVTNEKTGALATMFEDVTGNALEALGLIGGDVTLGQNAAYSVDGGPTRYSTSNTITDAVDGLTITVNDTTTEAVKINVNQANNTANSAMEGFVTQFNQVLQTLGTLTQYNEKGANGILFGDGTVRRIQQGLRSLVTQSVPGISGSLRTLSDVGISFGAVGTAAGEANRLVFDSAKFSAAMTANPEGVAQLMTVFTANAALSAGGTGSIASISGTPTNLTRTGTYAIASDGLGALQATFTPSDGSAPVISNGTITAGGTNTTLIAGVTLTATGSLQTGTDEVVIGASAQGFARSISQWIDSLTRVGGILQTRDEETSNIISSMNAQIDRMEARVAAREEHLVKKFTAMELAISRMQQQQQALTQMQTQLSSMSASRR